MLKESITQGVRLNLDTYAFPAYVASDGYDDVYEYALLDEAKLRIIYVYLSYPQSQELSGYRDYLKRELKRLSCTKTDMFIMSNFHKNAFLRKKY